MCIRDRNKTYVAYGYEGREKMELQEVQDSNARGYNKANAVSRTVSKSSKFYKNSSWDLVDAEQEADFSYEELKKEQLPKELKDKSVSEIKTYVENKRKERELLKTQINELNKQRRVYIANKTTKDSNGLENAMINAIKSQAKLKNYSWE